MEPARVTTFNNIYQVLLMWESLGLEELLAEASKV
jgi:hypothetical protein